MRGLSQRSSRGGRQRRGRKGGTSSALEKQHPLSMSGSVVTESSALPLQEHLSGLAARPALGTAGISWPGLGGTVLTWFPDNYEKEPECQVASLWEPHRVQSITVSHSLVTHGALRDQGRPEALEGDPEVQGGLGGKCLWAVRSGCRERHTLAPVQIGMRRNSTGC